MRWEQIDSKKTHKSYLQMLINKKILSEKIPWICNPIYVCIIIYLLLFFWVKWK
jgi:hypothetical protein